MRSPLTMLRLTYPRVASPKTVTSFQRVRSTHSPLLSRRLKLEATLTRSVEPTCLISPTRPMIVNSAIVFMSSILLSVSPWAFGSCRRSLGVRLTKKPGEAGQHPRGTSGPERQAEDGGGRRFCRARNSAVRSKGKIVDHEPLRRGSAGLKPPDDRGTHGHERRRPCASLARVSDRLFLSVSASSQHLVLRA